MIEGVRARVGQSSIYNLLRGMIEGVRARVGQPSIYNLLRCIIIITLFTWNVQ